MVKIFEIIIVFYPLKYSKLFRPNILAMKIITVIKLHPCNGLDSDTNIGLLKNTLFPKLPPYSTI